MEWMNEQIEKALHLLFVFENIKHFRDIDNAYWWSSIEFLEHH